MRQPRRSWPHSKQWRRRIFGSAKSRGHGGGGYVVTNPHRKAAKPVARRCAMARDRWGGHGDVDRRAGFGRDDPRRQDDRRYLGADAGGYRATDRHLRARGFAGRDQHACRRSQGDRRFRRRQFRYGARQRHQHDVRGERRADPRRCRAQRRAAQFLADRAAGLPRSTTPPISKARSSAPRRSRRSPNISPAESPLPRAGASTTSTPSSPAIRKARWRR